MILIDSIVIIILSFLSATVLYLFFLALLSIIVKSKSMQTENSYSFLILVPAHNEELVIEKTLENLLALESKAQVDITVIADNCDDKTVELASKYDVNVLERHNHHEIGKGYALNWALDKSDLGNYNAVAIIDADTQVENNILSAMANSFDKGAGAVQLYYGFSVVRDSVVSRLHQIANAVENVFFYKGRAILGLPILLRGTGMAFKSEVLKKYPWKAYSITEDVEYAVELITNNIKIDFNTDSAVYAPATSSYKQSASQKKRWSAGTFALIKDKMFPLLGQGIIKGQPSLFELGFSFLLLSRPALIYLTLFAVLLSLPGNFEIFNKYVLWGVTIIALLIIYLSCGVFLISDKKAGFKALLHIPIYGIWYLYIQLKALLGFNKMKWERTDRE